MIPFQRMLFLLLVSLFSAGLGSRVDAQTTSRFRHSKPIERVAAKDEEIVVFALDSDIYAATRPGLPDLRVADDKQAESPYQIEAEMEHRQERSRQVVDTVIDSLKPDGQKLEVRVKLPKDASNADLLIIATPLMNYERKVQVAGSVDGVKWETLVQSAVIFDYSKYMDVSNREIALPKNNDREFKITIEDVADERESPFKELTKTFREGKEDARIERTVIERRPFRIDRISAATVVVRDRVQQPRTASYPVASFEAKEDASKKQTIVTVKTRRQPLTGFTIETTSRNFSRRAWVETSTTKGDKTDWSKLAEATISNVSFRDQNQKHLGVLFPERRDETYRLVIANDDNPPLKIIGIDAQGTVQRVYFLAQPGHDYHVEYGSTTAELPRYDTATVLAKLSRDVTPIVAKLGAQTDNSEFRDPPATLSSMLNNWYFLGGAITLMVAVLGWCLFRAGTKLNDLPKE